MSTSHAPAARFGNQLLDRLPAGEAERLRPHLRPVHLEHDQLVYKAQGAIEFAYFPTRGVASFLTILGEGAAIEVATVGDEGMLGLPAVLAEATSSHETVIQIPGEGLRVP